MPDTIVACCPQCKRQSTAIKRYYVISRMLFLLLGAVYNTPQWTACSSCMRQKLRSITLAPGMILEANLIWPVVVLPWNAAYWLISFLPGHSRSVRKELE